MAGDADGRIARHLDVPRETAIFDAVLEILSEVGYDRLTMDAVASRVRAGKATLYRRWGSKADLVVDTLHRVKLEAGAPPDVNTGSLRADLISLCCGPAHDADERTMSVMCGLFTAMRHDRELARAVESRFIAQWEKALVRAFTLAKDRGEIRADADPALLARVIPGLVFFRLLTGGEMVDGDDTARIIDEVVLPAATAPAAATASASATVSAAASAAAALAAAGTVTAVPAAAAHPLS